MNYEQIEAILNSALSFIYLTAKDQALGLKDSIELKVDVMNQCMQMIGSKKARIEALKSIYDLIHNFDK